MATNTGDLYVNIRADIRDLKKGLDTATRDIKKFGRSMDRSTKQNDSFFKSFAKGRNDLVRTVRQLETLAVAAAAVVGAYKLMVGTGIELNKQYEDQALGISALISSKTDLIGVNGKELSSYEKFIATRSSMTGIMDDIKKASLETPASFQEMVGFYQQAVGHAMAANGTFGKSIEEVNKNVISMTQGMSALGSGVGMEMMKVNEEIRSIMSGNASTDSILAVILFGSPSEANEAVRNAKKTTDGLSTLILDALEPFRHMQDVITYSKAVNQLKNSFQDMQRGVTSDLFSDLTNAFVRLKEKLDTGMDGFIQSWRDAYNMAKAFFSGVLDAMSDLGSTNLNLIRYMSDWVDGIDGVKAAVIALKTVFRGVELIVLNIHRALLQASIWGQEANKALGTGAFNTDNVFTEKQEKHIAHLKKQMKDTSALEKRYLEENTKLIEDKIKAAEAALAADEKRLEELGEKIDKFKVWQPDEDAAQYDAVRYANDYLKTIRDSVKESKDMASATDAIAKATEKALANANGDLSIQRRIGDEVKAVLTSKEGQLLYEKSIAKMRGELSVDEKGLAKAARQAAKAEEERLRILKQINQEMDRQDEIGRQIKNAGKIDWFDDGQSRTLAFLKKEAELAKDKAIAANKAAKSEKDKLAAASLYTDYLQRQLDLTEAQTDSIQQLANVFKDGISNISSTFAEGGDIGGAIKGMVESGIGALKSGALGPYGQMAGYAIDIVRGLASSTVSQAEIDASIGQVEFSDESLKNLEDVFENAQYPMLEVTNKMHKHLRNMDANFYSVARAMRTEASAGGVDLTGVNFVDTMTSGFLGFSSKTISLIGTGLAFAIQKLGDAMKSAELDVQAYTTTLVKKSSLWGLVNSSKIRESFKDLPDSVVRDIADSFASGYEAIMSAGVALGLDAVDLEEALKSAEINIGKNGKVDFTGLSSEEVSDRLRDIFSNALSGVVAGIDDFSVLVDRYAQNTEYALETLIRIGTEYDQASHQFGLIGKQFSDGALIDVTKQVEVEMSRFVDKWGNAVTKTEDGFTRTIGGITKEFTGRMSSLFGVHEETWIDVADVMTQQAYTAQMQILDIVESAGGLQSFGDAMSSFMTNFYSDVEQLEFLTESMGQAFNTLGLSMPRTNEEFRNLLETMDTSTEEGSYLYGQLLLLSEGFANMTTAAEELKEAVDVTFESITDHLTGQYSFLTLKQKADYTSMLLAQTRLENDINSIVDASRINMEQVYRSASTREEFDIVSRQHLNVLAENIRQDATNQDIVDRLDALISRVEDLEETTRKAG